MNRDKEFKAYISEEVEENVFKRKIAYRKISDLPENDLIINVKYSTLNYKDALSARGHKGISRYYPHTPGVDAAGIVEYSKSPNFAVGDKVVVTGYDLGMNTSGGFAEYISVPQSWVYKLPENIDLKEAMFYGTAGITAAICLWEFERREISPDMGKILVTGATGAVGTMAVAFLAREGYQVIASTGKENQHEMLKSLGASEIISRQEVYDISNKPLLVKRWIGVVDTVGGNTLSTAMRSTDHHGAVCVLGLVESDKLYATVYPFLLRGIALIGIDSAEKKIELKAKLWDKIINKWRIDNYEKYSKEVSLEQLDNEINLILRGAQSGKVIVKISD